MPRPRPILIHRNQVAVHAASLRRKLPSLIVLAARRPVRQTARNPVLHLSSELPRPQLIRLKRILVVEINYLSLHLCIIYLIILICRI